MLRLGRVFLLSLLVLQGCATATIDKARHAYYSGDHQRAVNLLSEERVRSRNRLLALMEQGSIWHEAGEYRKSSDALLKAAAFVDAKDFHSISENAAALTTNDWARTYRGESAEKLWIHAYQIMNFLLLGEYESAAVEARRALEVLEQSSELESDYATRALLGLAFDAVNLPDHALIEYRKLYTLLPENTLIQNLVAHSAREAGIHLEDELLKVVEVTPADYAELIVFVANGQIPQKLSGNILVDPDHRISFPVYAQNQYSPPRLSISINSQSERSPTINSIVVTDMGDVARTALAARGARIAASHVARSIAKDAVVHAARHESETAAAALQIVFFLLEEADTRAWATLPAHLSIVRIPLPAGTHTVHLSDLNNISSTPIVLSDLEAKPGSKIYRRIRLE